MDVSVNTTDPNDKGLFKIASQNVVNLGNFTTVIARRGIDIVKHLKTNNMDGSLKNLIAHLKYKTRYKIFYEKLDPTLVTFLNDLEESDLKDFHRDSYMKFKPFGDELLRDYFLMNRKSIKARMKSRGYKKV